MWLVGSSAARIEKDTVIVLLQSVMAPTLGSSGVTDTKIEKSLIELVQCCIPL